MKTANEGGVAMDGKTRAEAGGNSDEDARRRKQAALADRKNRETHARLIGAQEAAQGGGKGGATAGGFTRSYFRSTCAYSAAYRST